MVTTSTYGARPGLLDPFGSACAAVGPSHASGLQQYPQCPRVSGSEAAPDTVDALDQQVNDQPLGDPSPGQVEGHPEGATGAASRCLSGGLAEDLVVRRSCGRGGGRQTWGPVSPSLDV